MKKPLLQSITVLLFAAFTLFFATAGNLPAAALSLGLGSVATAGFLATPEPGLVQSNTLTNLIPSIYSALDVVSRELVGLIPAVNRDSKADRVAKDQTLYSHAAPVNTVGNITPAMVVTAASDQTIANKSVTISNYKVSAFNLTGEEERSLNSGPGSAPVVQDMVEQAIRAHVNAIESAIATAMVTGASRAYGTAGTTPFASTLADPAQIRKILDDNGAPMMSRSLVINTTAGAALRTLAQLTKANEANDASLLRQGTLLDLHGFAIRESAQLPSGTTVGTGASYQLNGALSPGATTVTVDTGSGTILAGDVVTISGYKYVVLTALSGGSFTINAPGIVAAVADDTAITVNAAHTKNFGFSRNAVLLATRLPEAGTDDLATDRQVITDPRSGLSFEFAVYPGYRMKKVEIALAYGVSVIKPEHLAVLLG